MGNLSIGAVFGVIFLVVLLLGAIITIAAFSAGLDVLAIYFVAFFALVLIARESSIMCWAEYSLRQFTTMPPQAARESYSLRI
jgi:hypothetical protein